MDTVVPLLLTTENTAANEGLHRGIMNVPREQEVQHVGVRGLPCDFTHGLHEPNAVITGVCPVNLRRGTLGLGV